MDMILEGGIESDDDSIDEDALRDVECWSDSDDGEPEQRANTMIQDINRLMMPSAVDSMFDEGNMRGNNGTHYSKMSRVKSYRSVIKSQGAIPNRISKAIS